MSAEYQFPSVLTTYEEQKRYEAASEEIAETLKTMIKEFDRCTQLTAADYAVTINAR